MGESPKKVTGFNVSKGRPGKVWPLVEINSVTEIVPPIGLPIETDVPNFFEVRQLRIEFLLRQNFPEYEEWKARELIDEHCAELCQRARRAIRVIPAARPKAELYIPKQKTVSTLETVRTHLRPMCNTSSQMDSGFHAEISLPAFGFCV